MRSVVFRSIDALIDWLVVEEMNQNRCSLLAIKYCFLRSKVAPLYSGKRFVLSFFILCDGMLVRRRCD